LFLEFAAGTDISRWRQHWNALLECASEIRCFSVASRNLMMRAYPSLKPDIITIVPHRIEHVLLRKVTLTNLSYPVIGVIGHIATHKGSKIVQAVAEHIKRSGIHARIVVVGNIDVHLPPDIATITGPYRPELLPEILEMHSVNIGFFPSIWPETFSYVAEEMMVMGLPLVTFDIGAPGERVASYPRGCVLPFVEADVLLEKILAHYEQQLPSLLEERQLRDCSANNASR
jgi:glycosyltransferase involved in cell wall biosynthesis